VEAWNHFNVAALIPPTAIHLSMLNHTHQSNHKSGKKKPMHYAKKRKERERENHFFNLYGTLNTSLIQVTKEKKKKV